MNRITALRNVLAAAAVLVIAAVLAPQVASAQTPPPPNVFVCVENLTVPKTKTTGSQVYVVNNCLAIEALGYNIQKDVVTTSGAISTRGLQEVVIIKQVDNVFSPWLTMSGLTGSRWSLVTIQVHAVGCTPVPGCSPIFTLDLSNVYVSGVSTSANSGTVPFESVTLVFESVKVNFPTP